MGLMALIFDRFPSLAEASRFAERVRETYGRNVTIYTDADEAANADFYPFALTGTVVLVERPDYNNEEAIIALVRNFEGSFAGT